MAQGVGVTHVLAFCPDDPREAIVTTPALRALKRGCPSATVDVIAPPAAEAVAWMLPFTDHVSSRRDRGEQERICAISRLRYDAAVIFTAPGQSPHADAYGCYLAGIPVRIGISEEFAGGVLSHWIKPLPNTHPVDRHVSLTASIGFADAGRRLELRLPSGRRSSVSEHPALRPKGPYAAVLCSGPIDTTLARALVDKLAIPVVSVRVSSDGLSCLYRAPGRDDVAGEEGRSGEAAMLKMELIQGAVVSVTDDSLTALTAEALGRSVVFLADSSRSDRRYWPMEGTVLEREELDIEAIAACMQTILASMRS